MRRAKSLGFLVIVGLTNAALVYGCSSDSDAPPVTPPSTVDAAKEKETGSISADGQGGNEDVKDAGKDAKKDAKDAKKDGDEEEDAEVDAAIIYDPPGSPCNPATPIQRRPCGMCGDPSSNTGQSRVCETGADGGSVWSEWSDCINGPGAVCDPAQTYGDENCGNCGKRQRICQVDCTWVSGLTCNNEGPCKPGSTDWEQGLGCPSADGGLVGRTKTCNASCQPAIGACGPPPANPNNILVNSAATNAMFTKEFSYDSAKLLPRINVSAVISGGIAACPLTISTTNTAYQYIEVKNTTASAIKISVWTSPGATTPADEDDVMAYYPGGNYFLSAAERANNCGHYVDQCETDIGNTLTPIACALNAAGFLKGEPITAGTFAGIPLAAGASITVYVAQYSSNSFGNFKLNVKVTN